ncbi:flagellar motor protein MotB [Candidatus Odyssella thessalonicensis]|uniref:flagellar motor protein MotB n=1 Tax=Candidatus Odyssella thessalonicensis TaxID=84647 RepID=UPI000225B903|nr:flagellar motor protein MotB [Candidatus Odyssella thessalonicensis]
MSEKPPQPIIKKIKKVSGDGHHGGAWKIAYADFVTAMMAFFLLMWLLNATSEEQRRGIANYFDPFASTPKGGGNMGVMGGTSIKETVGTFDETQQNKITVKPTPPTEKGPGGEAAGVSENVDPQADDNGGKTEEERQKEAARREIEERLKKTPQTKAYASKQQEEAKLNEISEEIKQNLNKMPELKELSNNIKIELTNEGLNIEIIDQLKNAMFPSGSSRMYKQMEDILKSIAKAIQGVPNKIKISGHTDANQYSQRSMLTNWELSSERANASRRVLVSGGVAEERITSINGRADRELANPTNPYAPENRRVVITLLREIKE